MYINIIKNIKTGDLEVIKTFDPLPIHTIIEWGTNDGINLAKWKVLDCQPESNVQVTDIY